MYDCIIFDKDGVLLDSGINNFRWIDQTRSRSARKLGHNFTAKDSYKLIHLNTVEEVEELLKNKNMTWNEIKEIEKQVQQKKKTLIKDGIITLFPQVKQILQDIPQQKAIVSNAPKDVTEFTVKHFNIEKHFSKINASPIEKPKEYIQRKKPKPVMIEEVINELKPENPLMVGDTSADILAAKNAGIDVVHVNSYGSKPGAEPTYQIPRLEKITEILPKPSNK